MNSMLEKANKFSMAHEIQSQGSIIVVFVEIYVKFGKQGNFFFYRNSVMFGCLLSGPVHVLQSIDKTTWTGNDSFP